MERRANKDEDAAGNVKGGETRKSNGIDDEPFSADKVQRSSAVACSHKSRRMQNVNATTGVIDLGSAAAGLTLTVTYITSPRQDGFKREPGLTGVVDIENK